MKQLLLNLEKKLFQYSYISNRSWLENTIHTDFIECGKSGMLFDKQKTIQSLLQCKTDRDIIIYQFTCMNIDNNSWIVHYMTREQDETIYYRTSIWVKKDTMKLYFHQASKLEEKIVLIESN